MTEASLVPMIETPRLILRGHHVDDFRACADMWEDPKVVAHISGVPSPRDQSWARIMRYAGQWHHMGYGYWAVKDKETGAFLGEVGFGDFRRITTPDHGRMPEAGWVLTSAAHGQGIATEAVQAMLHWADENMPQDQTVAMFEPGFAASMNVARKVGFAGQVDGKFGDLDASFLYRPKGGS